MNGRRQGGKKGGGGGGGGNERGMTERRQRGKEMREG